MIDREKNWIFSINKVSEKFNSNNKSKNVSINSKSFLKDEEKYNKRL
jgi:hypothetical protein